MPVLATYFSVRRGRDPFFKFFMRTIFPRQVREYEEKFGIRFIGWYNVAYGWDFDNVILLDLPDYATIDKLEKDEATRALGHRAGEWIFERHHSMFLRERMGTGPGIPPVTRIDGTKGDEAMDASRNDLLGELAVRRRPRARRTSSSRPPSSCASSSTRTATASRPWAA